MQVLNPRTNEECAIQEALQEMASDAFLNAKYRALINQSRHYITLLEKDYSTLSERVRSYEGRVDYIENELRLALRSEQLYADKNPVDKVIGLCNNRSNLSQSPKF